jgi:RHS repeat-associated protein
MMIENFQVNSLNELTVNTNGGRLRVMGTTTSVATNVTVNTTNAARYGDATFAATNMPLTTTYTAIASDSLGRSATNVVNTSITNNTFQYDGNGNLTNDGLHSFAYDDENQLIQVWVPSQWFSQFTYDGKMRRRIRQEFTAQGSGWVQTNEVYYVYDGNVVIQERDINNLPTTTYTRGKDLSGSLEGAGGIGGLLSMTLNTGPGPVSSNSSFYHSDGNGNITMLINSSQGIAAKYLYDAFGNVLSKSGVLAAANLYRFSSKEAHPSSGLIYYLYRYSDPNLQRWPNRNPLEEIGSATLRGDTEFDIENTESNLYTTLENNLNNHIDPYGLATINQFRQIKQEIQWAQSLRNAIQNAQNGKGCPCLDSVDAYICGCFVSNPNNLAEFATCVCQTSPDPTDCERRARKVADPIYKWKNNIQKAKV